MENTDTLRIGFMDRIKSMAMELVKELRNTGRDDPRLILHSVRVGSALTSVSFLYYINRFEDHFAPVTLWATIAVVVVIDFTFGATMWKGLIAIVGSFVACALAVGSYYVASLPGPKAKSAILSVLLFLLASAASFFRLVPGVKKRFDFGLLIFILSLGAIIVPSYRTDAVFKLAYHRLCITAMSVVICLIVSVFVFPVWAGTQLHDLTALNLERLAGFLEGLGTEYLTKSGTENLSRRCDFMLSYRGAVSGATEDALAFAARWEPGHGKFRWRHPWALYLKIGELIRHCGSLMDTIVILITAPATPDSHLSPDMCSAYAELFSECGEALKTMVASIRGMTLPLQGRQHITRAIVASEQLRIMKAKEMNAEGTVVVEIVRMVGLLCSEVEELAQLAPFLDAPRDEGSATVAVG